MSKIKWAAIGLNVALLLATAAAFFGDHRGFGEREIVHYLLIALFTATSVTSLAALWPSARAQTRLV